MHHTTVASKALSEWRNPQQLNETELIMQKTPPYSNLLSCLYDESEPVGRLGSGAHYSVFRSVEWLNVQRKPLKISEVHDFAVIWDYDHDTRIIPLIENIYMAGLLSPVQFIGESQGHLTILIAAQYRSYGEGVDEYQRLVTEITNNMGGDHWFVEVGDFDRSPHSPQGTSLQGIVNDNEDKVYTYLRTIDILWRLGTKPFVPNSNFDGTPSAPPSPPPLPVFPFPTPPLPPKGWGVPKP